MAKAINTDHFSAVLRKKSIDVQNHRLLITRLRGSEQEAELTEPPNCNGFGRIRHFRRQTSKGWPSNPLPIDPACRQLELTRNDSLRAQVSQNAACNWRCWYCYVPFSLLNADPEHSEWLTGGLQVRRKAKKIPERDSLRNDARLFRGDGIDATCF
jgi:hypothetical protein